MITAKRRYDIDWLRVIAIGLLIVYHTAIGFQPWGVFIGFIQNNEPLESVWIPMSMLNVWRIPLLFFVSGMGVCFAIRKRNLKKLLLERSQRILVPFIFGTLAIVPLHIWLWQRYYHQDIEYVLNPSHLWFLGNIFVYVLILSPVFFLMKAHHSGTFHRSLTTIFSKPLGVLLLTIPFMVEAVLLNPESFEVYAMTFHGFWLGLIAFFSGYCIIFSGDAFWQTLLKWRRWSFVIALGLYLLRLIAFEVKGPNYLTALESCLWVFAVFGYGYKYLNHPSKALSYLSKAAYPIYIIHMFFLYAGSALFFPWNISAELKFILLNLFTLLSSFALYELVIKRVNALRPLFGLKMTRPESYKKAFLSNT